MIMHELDSEEAETGLAWCKPLANRGDMAEWFLQWQLSAVVPWVDPGLLSALRCTLSSSLLGIPGWVSSPSAEAETRVLLITYVKGP